MAYYAIVPDPVVNFVKVPDPMTNIAMGSGTLTLTVIFSYIR